MILALTGHRAGPKMGGFQLPNPIYIKVCQATEAKLKELKPEKVISGMALGFDQWGAYIAHKLGIPFVAAVPFAGQEKKWPIASQKTYHRLLKLASEVVVVSEGEYSPEKMQVRNQWMIDGANMVLACWDGSDGGTKNAVMYAEKIGKPIVRINPKEL
jgi:uncharacterized phage-like protein YoqJ